MIVKRMKVVGSALALALVAGCGGGGNDADPASGEDLVLEGETVATAELWSTAQEEGSLTLYTAHFEAGEMALAEVFTEDTGIDVEVVRLPGSRLHERILSEHGAGQLGADVVHQSDLSLNVQYAEEGIVESYTIPEELDANIGDDWKAEDGTYYATFISLMGIIYNNQLVDAADAPSSWSDLLDPQWQGTIAMPFAGIGGSGWAMALFQDQELGDNYWEDLAAQDPSILQSSSSIAEETARGEYPIAVNALATSMESVIQGAPVSIVYPEEGTPAVPYALSKVADSPSPNAAALYMNWRNSLRGLTAGVEEIAVYTPHADTPPPPGADGERQPPFEEINPWVADDEDWVNLREEYVADWNEVYGFAGG